jgi:hypothetical protein
MIKSDTIAQLLDTWHVTPQPERVTELFFTDYAQLPTHARPQATQTVRFTLRNHEHQSVHYRYQLRIQPAKGTPTLLPVNQLTLEHGQEKTLTQSFTMPEITGRARISLELTYRSGQPAHLQHQSINYWVALLPGDQR